MRSTVKPGILLGAIAAGLALTAFVALANDRATWVVQSFVSGVRILHTKGLSGSGQLVTVADGGPWMDHPALADPNRPFDCQNPNGSVGPLHRKVEAYLSSTCGGPGNCDNPHGTHDAGTIAGDAPPYGSWNDMDGHAFGSRLIVVDLGVGQCVPTDEELTAEVYQPSYDLGSRIVSEGFGTTNSGGFDYNTEAEESDEFAWNHKDYLMVIGSGNEGHKSCSGSGTACSTSADCPHEVCVGGGGICSPGGGACQFDSDCPPPNGHCVISGEGGTCQGSGAGCNSSNDCPLEQCPGFSRIRSEAQAKNVITVGASKNGSLAQEVTSFSSWGPAADGRLKPTLLAPGLDICTASPNPGDGCLPGVSYYESVQGTSFSHPAVSGSAALVRQYFTGGWYPSGIQGSSPTVNPSSALLRAVMINSATEMTGAGAYPNPSVPKYPNAAQGWGRLLLDNALYFSGDTRKLVVCQDKNGFTTMGQQRQVNFTVAGSSVPLEATLVWTDPPRVPYDAHAVQLVNDLDLLVTSPNSGPQYKGNVFAGGNPGQSGTGGLADHVNVEENVLRYSPTTGNWNVKVTAYNQMASAQPFALAITGNLSVFWGYVGAVADYQTSPGEIFQNNWAATLTSNNTREVLKETSGGLTHTWIVDNVPCSSSRHLLHLEGNRPNNSDGDNFQFYYSTDGTSFTLIPGALIDDAKEGSGGWDSAFDDAGLMGRIYIQVRDTVAGGGSSLDKVHIDHLEIR